MSEIRFDDQVVLVTGAGLERGVDPRRVQGKVLADVAVVDGEHFPLHPARIYESLRTGTERATVEHPLRSNTVHTLTRENTGQNVGYRVPIVHWHFVPDWDGLDVKCVPKGSGSVSYTHLTLPTICSV